MDRPFRFSAGETLLVLVGLKTLQDRNIFQCGGVAYLLRARGNVAQEAAHDLAAPRLGQRTGEAHVVNRAIGAQQKDNWDAFMKSVEERKKQKEEPGS